MEPTLEAIRGILSRVDSKLYGADTGQKILDPQKQLLLDILDICVLPNAKNKLDSTLRAVKCTEGIKVPRWKDQPAEQHIDSALLIGDGKDADNKTAQLQLMALPDKNSGTLNNLGCAYMWLHDWDEADRTLCRAKSPETKDFKTGKEDASHNYVICQQAMIDYATWQIALRANEKHIARKLERLKTILQARQGILNVILILLLIFACMVVPLLITMPSRTLNPGNGQVPLELKVSDLAGGASLAERGKYVTLVTAKENDKKALEIARFNNLWVHDLLDATGRSVVYTGDLPTTIVLEMSADEYDPVVQALQEKKAAYLESQTPDSPIPTPTLAPTLTPQPFATPVANKVVFALPVAKIQSELKQLKPGLVDVILVSERKDDAGKVILYDSQKYDASWLDVIDAKGVRVNSTDDTAASVRVSLESGTVYSDVKNFAGQLPGVVAIYLVQDVSVPVMNRWPRSDR